MALEVERKYLDVDFALLRRRLEAAGARDCGTHFESNIVFDTPDGRLFASGRLLRLRSQEWPARVRHVLTLKLPASESDARDAEAGCFKAREERELEVPDAEAMSGVLQGLGYAPVARYEKLRSLWQLTLRAGPAAQGGRTPGVGETMAASGSPSVEVALDELPFCRAVEVEGEAGAIDAAAAALGLDKTGISTKSYHALHQEWRRQRGLAAELSFTFAGAERDRLRKALGLPR